MSKTKLLLYDTTLILWLIVKKKKLELWIISLLHIL